MQSQWEAQSGRVENNNNRRTLASQKALLERTKESSRSTPYTRQAKEKKSEWIFLPFFVSVARPFPSSVLCMSVLGSMADISSIIYEDMKSDVLISILVIFYLVYWVLTPFY